MAVGQRESSETQYLSSFDDGAMTIPEGEMPDVAKAAQEVVQEAKKGRRVGFQRRSGNQRASVVATDGTVTDGPYPETNEVLGGFAVVDLPHARRGSSGRPRSPSPAAVLKRSGSPCPTRVLDRRRPARLAPRCAWGARSAHRPVLGRDTAVSHGEA